MTVKCIKYKQEQYDSEIGNYIWEASLLVGKTYYVISISYDDYLLMSEGQNEKVIGPSLFPKKFFTVVDKSASTNWVKEYDEGEISYHGPPEFAGFFWEEFHDKSISEQKQIITKYRHLLFP